MYFHNWEVRNGVVYDIDTNKPIKREYARGIKGRHFRDTIEIGHMLETYKFEGE